MLNQLQKKARILLVFAILPILLLACTDEESESVVAEGGSTSIVDFSVGGTVSGLTGTLVIQNNAMDDLTLEVDGEFTFHTRVAEAADYNVTVLTQPEGQTCSVINGAGTITDSNVSDVEISCSSSVENFSVGGTVDGLVGTLIIQNNAADYLTLEADGNFTFDTLLEDGTDYEVTVVSQPDSQICEVVNGTGMITGSNVSDVTITCASNVVTLSALTLSGGTLLPEFSSGITSYGSSQPLASESITVTPTASDSASTITVNGEPVASDTASEAIPLNLGGGNVITILVTAADGDTTQTYDIIVERGFEAEAYLKAPNAEAEDRFGYSVAISGDTIVVGARLEDSQQTSISNDATASSDNTAPDSGAVYVFVRSGTVWGQQAYIKAPNADEGDRFGGAVAISGDTIVVGARQEASLQQFITNGTTANETNTASGIGAAYVFVRSGTTWSQQAYLKASSNGVSDLFGHAVAIADDTIVVGVLYEESSEGGVINGSTASVDNSASHAGAAYVFSRSGTIWSQQAYLKAPIPEANDVFGTSVAVSGDSIVVGAPGEDSNQNWITNGPTASSDNSASGSGAAYVFIRSGTTWSQQAYLKAANARSPGLFGNSVAISANTIVVGADWENSNQSGITNGSTASDDSSAAQSGAAYVFVRSGDSWTQEAYLKASNSEEDDRFGASVAISGDAIVVGAGYEDSQKPWLTYGPTASSDNSAWSSGAVYLFLRDGTTWRQGAYRKAPNAGQYDYFGNSVAISGDTIVVGTFEEDSNQTSVTADATVNDNNATTDSGAAYVFH